MKFRNLSFRKGFRVHRGNRRSEAAEMVIEPGGLLLARGSSAQLVASNFTRFR